MKWIDNWIKKHIAEPIDEGEPLDGEVPDPVHLNDDDYDPQTYPREF